MFANQPILIRKVPTKIVKQFKPTLAQVKELTQGDGDILKPMVNAIIAAGRASTERMIEMGRYSRLSFPAGLLSPHFLGDARPVIELQALAPTGRRRR